MPVPVVRQERASNSLSTFVWNKQILTTPSGLLKLAEVVVGAICVTFIAYYKLHEDGYIVAIPPYTFFFVVSFAYLISTFVILVSYLASPTAASVIPKTIFELLYHSLAFIFYLSASLALLAHVTKNKDHPQFAAYPGRILTVCLGIVNSILYFFSILFSFRSCRSAT